MIVFLNVSSLKLFAMDGFPSGQRGQTVNLLAMPSKVRILLRPLHMVYKYKAYNLYVY